MLIKKENTRKHSSPTCTVSEHDHPTKDLSYATVHINGRYPEERKSLNLECETIFLGISGTGIIQSKRGTYEISPQDSCYVPKGEKYWIKGNDLVLGVMNSPRWTPEQYRIVD